MCSHIVSVAIASGKHPVSIPNLEVKPDSADGTATGRSWESRTPPDIHTVKGHPNGVALNILPGPFAAPPHCVRGRGPGSPASGACRRFAGELRARLTRADRRSMSVDDGWLRARVRQS